MKKEEFQKLITDQVFYMDGATGTNLYAAGMPHGICVEGWLLEHPQVLASLQKDYVENGSMMVYAPTFGANRNSLRNYDMDGNVADLNKRLVEISQKAVGGKALVAGDMAPTGMMLECCGGEDSEDEVFEVYREQASVLAECGVDLIGVETMMSLAETQIAVDAINSVCDKPIICSMTVAAGERTLYGDRVSEAASLLEDAGVCAFGVNCSKGPDKLSDVIAAIRLAADLPIIAKPNAGLPQTDGKGGSFYSMSAEEFARHMLGLHQAGASLLGGCCGTTPAFIRETKRVISGDVKLVRR